MNRVLDIERAIDTLSPAEMNELWLWLDRHPQRIDIRMQSDLESGRLDDAIEQALNDERSHRVQAL